MSQTRDTNAISMSTSDLRKLLRQAGEQGLGLSVRIANDIPGPGGSVFIASHSRLTPRHLSWLEQRNPAASTRPTYVDVILQHESRGGGRDPDGVAAVSEPMDSARHRLRRATEISRDVATKAADVSRQAGEVYRIVGASAFTAASLHHPEVRQNLCQLNERIRLFHDSVRTALDEYLLGNTLIMDLITRHDLAARTVQHGLDVAVFATEIASQVMLKAGDDDDLGSPAQSRGTDDDEAMPERADAPDPGLQSLKRSLAEIFLGGFMHDCGLWHEEATAEESHEAAGAHLIWQIPEIHDFLPSLTKIILFHSDVLRIAAKPGLVQIAEHPGDADRTSFRAEFYRSLEDARTAAGLRSSSVQAEALDTPDLHKVLPVAMAEYCITHSEGFNARSRAEVVGRLATQAQNGLYSRYAVALCNAQVEVIAPRRAYVLLGGHITASGREVCLEGHEAGSMWHTDDMYSPHLITLFAPGPDGSKQRLDYLSPHDPAFWGRGSDPGRRLYIPARRHRDTLSVMVTGFMSEDVYTNILGTYELELKRQMQP